MSERWGVARWGVVEVALSLAAGAAGAAAIAWLAPHYWYAAAVPAGLGLFGVMFFRDPARIVPKGEENVVAPADGRVTEVCEVDEPSFIGGRALKIGIFLSIFDVHINRSPCAGSVGMVRHKPGRFLNALRRESATENESNSIGIQGARCRMLVRQIAGVIARRIVCACKEGDRLARGEKLGMIKFGSRTELYVPADARFELKVKPGDHVRAGSSVMGTLR